ncbi:hypothetical protein NQ318_012508 [Aromia moschata]|uniref:Uncharacterized protein n=1 Tax=Aromia moschata TaxID=1265417 RepID=A0AAV8XE34_9CUCU|nr:hypothetical protein NQ318_012508 [Aromia moschata]
MEEYSNQDDAPRMEHLGDKTNVPTKVNDDAEAILNLNSKLNEPPADSRNHHLEGTGSNITQVQDTESNIIQHIEGVQYPTDNSFSSNIQEGLLRKKKHQFGICSATEVETILPQTKEQLEADLEVDQVVEKCESKQGKQIEESVESQGCPQSEEKMEVTESTSQSNIESVEIPENVNMEATSNDGSETQSIDTRVDKICMDMSTKKMEEPVLELSESALVEKNVEDEDTDRDTIEPAAEGTIETAAEAITETTEEGTTTETAAGSATETVAEGPTETVVEGTTETPAENISTQGSTEVSMEVATTEASTEVATTEASTEVVTTEDSVEGFTDSTVSTQSTGMDTSEIGSKEADKIDNADSALSVSSPSEQERDKGSDSQRENTEFVQVNTESEKDSEDNEKDDESNNRALMEQDQLDLILLSL